MIHHLRAAGVGLILDSRGTGVPVIIHWGRDLGSLAPDELIALADATIPAVPPSSLDAPLRFSLLSSVGDGFTGRPAVAIEGGGAARHLRTSSDDNILHTTSAVDDVSVTTRVELTPQGVVLVSHRVTNNGADARRMTEAAVSLPVPDRARELLDFTGRWAGEREPQRTRPGHGTWVRESRHGRGGHDDPFLMVAGTPGFGFEAGEVWSTHVAWSGDTRQWFERSDLGVTALGAGERLGVVTLHPGAVYESPQIVATWSDRGLDGLSDRIHPWVRSWSSIAGDRPLTLNTWEAVYFDHSIERLAPLVARAAEVGVERFVLDDGWFRGRTDDKRALGDWTVDERNWPQGLGPLIDLVVATGMTFGLWVEPEMVSLDSDLARAHPEWILPAADGATWRWQHTLNLAHPDAFAYVFARLDALLVEYRISYLKWDHNRDLLVDDSRPQVQALYRLLDALRSAHPDVEIESCASGGGRIDLGILRRVDRVWTSDTNDPLVRQRIQRWTGILIPPEYLGSHVGDARAHTTGRSSDLAFRMATALFLHAGIESDLTKLGAPELTALRVWSDAYRSHRDLLHAGRVVRADSVDDAVLIHGVVSRDRREALYSYGIVDATDSALAPALVCPGLDPERMYEVRIIDLGAAPAVRQDTPPPWFDGGLIVRGSVLMAGVVSMPLLLPGNALVVHVAAV